MANLKKKEKIYSAMYFLSTAFLTYHYELIELMKKDGDSCPELVRLQKAIDDVLATTQSNSMSHKQKMSMLDDHENLKKIIDKFMRI